MGLGSEEVGPSQKDEREGGRDFGLPKITL